MNRASIDDELPKNQADTEPDEQIGDDVNVLAAYDEQLRQGTVSCSLTSAERQARSSTPPVELIDCLHLIEKIWPRSGRLSDTPGLPQQIGRFQIERVLGHGGFGVVYLAVDPTLRRRVAVKVPRLHSLASEKLRDRFRREARAAATLDHPNIVPIHETGEEGPLCYIASAYCEGPNLADWIKTQKSPVAPRLAASLVSQLADAAHYSHSQGVLHRDIKPSNILLSPRTAETGSKLAEDIPFVPRLADFGLAKLLEDESEATAASTTLGTPAYMAPEQCGTSTEPIGLETDVYALGTVLYELLTGRAPFQGTNVAELLDQVRYSDVVPPRRLRPEVPSDLELICEKCLEKQPSRRYATCAELAEDLRRFVDGLPIRARRPGRVELFCKWVKRRPALAAVWAVSVLAALLLALGGWYHNHRLAAELRISQQLRRESLSRERALREQMYAADIRIAWKALQAGDVAGTLQHLQRCQTQGEQEDPRGFEWHYLLGNCQPAMHTVRGHAAPILSADLSPDDRFLASADRAGVIKICDFATRKEIQTLHQATQEATCVRFSPNGKLLASCGMDRNLRIWSCSDWTEQCCLPGHERTICSLAWSPDGQQIATGDRNHQIKIWNVQEQREVLTLPAQADAVRCVAWSPDGRVLATAVRAHGLELWDTRTWKSTKSLREPGYRGILALAFSPDSQQLASAGYSGSSSLMVSSVAAGTALAEFDGLGNIWSLRFTPDGSSLIAGEGGGQMHCFEQRVDTGSWVERVAVKIGESAIRSVAFSSNGQTLVAALEDDRVLQVRSTAELGGYSFYRHHPACRDISLNTHLALGIGPDGTLQLARFPQSAAGDTPVPKTDPVHDAVFIPGVHQIAASGKSGDLWVIDLLTGRVLHRAHTSGEKLGNLTVSADGKHIAGSTNSGMVWLWSLDRAASIRRLAGHLQKTVRAAFSNDGKLLATGSSNEQRVSLWDVADARQLAELPTHQDAMALAFDPTGQTLAVATFADGVQFWDVADRRLAAALRGHEGSLRSLAFSPDGETLATVGDDGTARLWHATTRQELLVLTRHSVPLHWVKFLSPRQLVIGTAPYGMGPQGAGDVLLFEAQTLLTSNNR